MLLYFDPARGKTKEHNGGTIHVLRKKNTLFRAKWIWDLFRAKLFGGLFRAHTVRGISRAKSVRDLSRAKAMRVVSNDFPV